MNVLTCKRTKQNFVLFFYILLSSNAWQISLPSIKITCFQQETSASVIQSSTPWLFEKQVQLVCSIKEKCWEPGPNQPHKHYHIYYMHQLTVRKKTEHRVIKTVNRPIKDLFKRHILLGQMQEVHSPTILALPASQGQFPGKSCCAESAEICPSWVSAPFAWELLWHWNSPPWYPPELCCSCTATTSVPKQVPYWTGPQPVDLASQLRLASSPVVPSATWTFGGCSQVCPAWFAAYTGLPGHLPLQTSPSLLPSGTRCCQDTPKNMLSLLTQGFCMLWLHSSSSDHSP